MATVIRLSRGGTKKKPHYSIVVTNSRSPRDSKIIEKIGTYSPLLLDGDAKRVEFNEERMKYWLGQGATPSERVTVFLRKAGIVTTAPVYRSKKQPKKAKGAAPEAATEAASAPVAEAPAA